ncbi:hypothetical protein UNDKW_4914 [Undibacterium sp. KW1]|uniref:hypothetical protein n=1 Tax=Undibacterium sp. KW1 TaxID=2058624 RepID=UPI001331CDEB|nr:hypothetical protein [Undibacterium sp. KW1]BBB63187.1 hypothetical protein UNDKW_4914 [Undibacterium sp. KW1]
MSDTAKQIIRIERFHETVEEEVVLNNGTGDLVCFFDVRPYQLIVGHSYSIRLNFLILDDPHIREIDDDSESLILRCGSGYSYQIQGRLVGDRLYACGYEFEDEAFEYDCAFLDGKMISIDVDRINAKFLPLEV